MRIGDSSFFSSQYFSNVTSSTSNSADTGFSAILDDEETSTFTFGDEEALETRKNEYEAEQKAEKSASHDDIISKFLEYSDMTLAEKIRASYLDDHNLTEEQLAAMPEDERKAIEDAIQEAIKQQLGVDQDAGSSEEAIGL
ncbi:hypothetical protein ACO34A_10740 [Rhizobium sp. ACO-34A]|nr:hypothetical protein [Rhizobium sp. ACO-34A]ATN34278.1 hypothetical protein ACO34A_10740 [Rhizobium sp. ACO-34A]